MLLADPAPAEPIPALPQGISRDLADTVLNFYLGDELRTAEIAERLDIPLRTVALILESDYARHICDLLERLDQRRIQLLAGSHRIRALAATAELAETARNEETRRLAASCLLRLIPFKAALTAPNNNKPDKPPRLPPLPPLPSLSSLVSMLKDEADKPHHPSPSPPPPPRPTPSAKAPPPTQPPAATTTSAPTPAAASTAPAASTPARTTPPALKSPAPTSPTQTHFHTTPVASLLNRMATPPPSSSRPRDRP